MQGADCEIAQSWKVKYKTANRGKRYRKKGTKIPQVEVKNLELEMTIEIFRKETSQIKVEGDVAEKGVVDTFCETSLEVKVESVYDYNLGIN